MLSSPAVISGRWGRLSASAAARAALVQDKDSGPRGRSPPNFATLGAGKQEETSSLTPTAVHVHGKCLQSYCQRKRQERAEPCVFAQKSRVGSVFSNPAPRWRPRRGIGELWEENKVMTLAGSPLLSAHSTFFSRHSSLLPRWSQAPRTTWEEGTMLWKRSI